MKKFRKISLKINDLRKNKIAFFLYFIFTSIYSNITTFLENIFLKKKFMDSNFKQTGIFKIDSPINFSKMIELCEQTSEFKEASNLIVQKTKIKHLLNEIFNEELRKNISNKTGFNFSIDYFRIYKNKFELQKTRFAHFDKPYSKNMLKIFIPLNTDLDSGPLKVFDKFTSKLIKKGLKKTENFILLTGNGDLIYGINPNVCFHEEGNPKKDNHPIQMMFQLNPSKFWSYRTDLYERQLRGENKFTSLISILDKSNNFRLNR